MIASEEYQAACEALAVEFLKSIVALSGAYLSACPNPRSRCYSEAQGAMQALLCALMEDGGDHAARVHGIGLALGTYVAAQPEQLAQPILAGLARAIAEGESATRAELEPRGRA